MTKPGKAAEEHAEHALAKPERSLLEAAKAAWYLCQSLLAVREGATDQLIREVRDVLNFAIVRAEVLEKVQARIAVREEDPNDSRRLDWIYGQILYSPECDAILDQLGIEELRALGPADPGYSDLTFRERFRKAVDIAAAKPKPRPQ